MEEKHTKTDVVPEDTKEFFGLARRVKSELNTQCREQADKPCDDVKFLWMYVTRRGINVSETNDKDSNISLDRWLNVIDEAAALGVCWLVITLQESFSSYPDMWEICDWAQQTHGMTVGIHTETEVITEAERVHLRNLDASRTRLFVPNDFLARFAHIEAEDGIRVRSSEPESTMASSACDKPGAMVFVNSEGILCTCGMVQDNSAYRMGRVDDVRFDQIARQSCAPKSVSPEHFHTEHGCDGCPPLLARHLQED